MRRNPAPVPVNLEVVRACHAAIVALLEAAVTVGHRRKIIAELFSNFGDKRAPLHGDADHRILIGTFAAPIWIGRHRPPMHRKVPVYLELATRQSEKSRQNSHDTLWIGGYLLPPQKPFDAPERLVVKINALYQLRHWGYITDTARAVRKIHHLESDKLWGILVHEFTHASDYVVSRQGQNADSKSIVGHGDLPKYFNHPVEIRARFNEYLHLMLLDYNREVAAVARGMSDRSGATRAGFAENWANLVLKHNSNAGFEHLTPANRIRFKERLIRLAHEAGIP